MGKKTVKLNAWIDILAAIVLVVSMISGFVLWLALPSSGGRHSGADADSSFVGVNRDVWKSVHLYSSIGFSLLALAHLALHRTWFTRCMPAIVMGKRKEVSPEGECETAV
jgi:hypothetical protein